MFHSYSSAWARSARRTGKQPCRSHGRRSKTLESELERLEEWSRALGELRSALPIRAAAIDWVGKMSSCAARPWTVNSRPCRSILLPGHIPMTSKLALQAVRVHAAKSCITALRTLNSGHCARSPDLSTLVGLHHPTITTLSAFIWPSNWASGFLCVCVCVYYIYIYIYVHSFSLQVYLLVYPCIYVYIRTYIHSYMYIYTYRRPLSFQWGSGKWK